MSLSLHYFESGYVVINRKVMSVLGPNEAIVIGELVNLIKYDIDYIDKMIAKLNNKKVHLYDSLNKLK